jgi:glutamate:GABA antiporter
MVAVWCQFAQTIFYYPALLAYVGGTLAYVIDQHLATSGVYTGAVIVALFWLSVLVTSRGRGLLTKLAAGGTVIGTLVPAALLVGLGVAYLIQGNHSQAPITTHHLLPVWNGLAGLVLIINSFFTYAGAEVNAVHVDELKNPGREFPKAMFVAAAIVLAIFILPTLAISWVIPSAKISLTTGVMQAFDGLFKHFGLSWAVPVVAVALAAGALAGMMSWLDGPSEGLLKIGREQGYLPPYFQKLDHEGIQVRILAAQGVVITIIGLLYALVPNVSSAYWVLAAMATQVYLIMYVLMFTAAVRLRRSQPDHPRGYRAPALYAQCVVGVLASVAAFAIGFVPPSQFSHVAGPVVYGVLILAGVVLIGVLPPLLLEWRRKPSWKEPAPAQKPAQS